MGGGDELHLEVRDETVLVVGEVDLTNAECLKSGLLAAANGHRVVIADLERLSFIDASGLTALIAAERQLRDQERVLVLRNPKPIVKRTLDVTGLTWLLERST
jgi:anti-sigma B factor antagonist